MSFDLRKLDNQTWQILDQTDRVVYSGSLDNCRDWLDLQEGSQQRTFMQKVTGWFSRHAEKSSVISSQQSASESGVLN